MVPVVPVYIVTGFLDSGKTTLIKNTLSDPDFNGDKVKTLLIVLEQGEVEYDDAFLKENNICIEYFSSIDELTNSSLCSLQKQHQPEQVFIEFNGMDKTTDFYKSSLPDGWQIVQTATTIDAGSFAMYVANMRSLIYEQCKFSDLVIFNRCDEYAKKSMLRGNIKAINRSAQIVYESVDGSVDELIDDDLPFDINADIIDISDDNYGLWYMDTAENPSKYANKKIRLRAKFAQTLPNMKSSIIIGRNAMVCCNEDTSLIGITATQVKIDELKKQQWYEFEGTLKLIHAEGSFDTIVLYVSSIKNYTPPKDPFVYFR